MEEKIGVNIQIGGRLKTIITISNMKANESRLIWKNAN